MGKRGWWILLSLLPFLPLLLIPQQASAQGGAFFFQETGHWVRGEFLDTYERSLNPLIIYGLPITDAFVDDRGRLTQYFEKARFVLHPSEPQPLRVKLTPIGQLIYNSTGPGTPLQRPPGLAGCRRFAETGKEVCYAFLEFFEAYGGLAQFGYPISDFEAQAGRIVQYFQLARLEWHPELSVEQRVLVADLGREYFKMHEKDYRLLLPGSESNLPQFILRIQASASLERRVTPFIGMQTVYVMVQDQNLTPVPNAAVEITVRLPHGSSVSYTLPPTDQNGISQRSFSFFTDESAEIEILVEAAFQGRRATTWTSFQTWP